MKRLPLRAKGAVLINPRPKRGAATARRAKLAALFSTKRRKNPRRRRAARTRSLGELVINPRPKRRRARRNPSRTGATRRRRALRRNPRSKRRLANPRRRALRRNPRRKARRTIARGSVIRTRRNPRRRSSVRRRAMRRNPRRSYRRRRNGMSKIPVVGGILSTLASLVPQGVFGALSVEPTLFVAQLASRYFPNMSTTALYPLSGLVVGTAFAKLLPKLGFSARTAEQLAIATVSAGGAVGYYKWRTGQSTEAVNEMAGLVMAGYGSPLAGLVMGNAGLGELVALSGYGAPQYAGLPASYASMNTGSAY